VINKNARFCLTWDQVVHMIDISLTPEKKAALEAPHTKDLMEGT
jgi:hypothetical protein